MYLNIINIKYNLLKEGSTQYFENLETHTANVASIDFS